jgi:hypothetical protein
MLYANELTTSDTLLTTKGLEQVTLVKNEENIFSAKIVTGVGTFFVPYSSTIRTKSKTHPVSDLAEQFINKNRIFKESLAFPLENESLFEPVEQEKPSEFYLPKDDFLPNPPVLGYGIAWFLGLFYANIPFNNFVGDQFTIHHVVGENISTTITSILTAFGHKQTTDIDDFTYHFQTSISGALLHYLMKFFVNLTIPLFIRTADKKTRMMFYSGFAVSHAHHFVDSTSNLLKFSFNPNLTEVLLNISSLTLGATGKTRVHDRIFSVSKAFKGEHITVEGMNGDLIIGAGMIIVKDGVKE